jgi:hypothetical protein
MTDKNEAAKQQLVSLLKEKRAVLMVGAGSSKLADFPLLNELIDKLSQLTPSLLESEGTELTAYADLIKDQLDKEGRIREYYKSLDKIFRPKKNRNNHTAFHCALVKLGFCGIITTNYDIVLETAVGEAFSKDSYWRCDPIDLCLPTKNYSDSKRLSACIWRTWSKRNGWELKSNTGYYSPKSHLGVTCDAFSCLCRI